MRKILNKNSSRTDVWLLLLACAVSVVIRLLTRQADVPIIINDEAVYPNLAKSILNMGELRFFGMSISYIYILYPLLILPVYLLGTAVNRYLVFGIIGAVIMSGAAVPAYLLGKKISGNRAGAWCAAGLLLLMPDMSFSTRSMNESLCYALFYWTLFFAWKAISEKKPSLYGVVALLSLLAFFTKPGYVAIGAVTLVLGVVFGLRDKNRAQWVSSAVSAVALGAAIVTVRFLIISVFSVNTDSSAYYTAGVSDAGFSWGLALAMVRYFFSYITYFVISCGIVGVLVPLFGMKRLDKNQRRILIILLVSALATVVGALITVHIDQYINYGNSETTLNRIHLRYLAAYVPLMFSFVFCGSLSPRHTEGKGKKKLSDHIAGKLWYIPAIILSVLLLVFRINGVSLTGCYFDAYILIIFRTLCNTLWGQFFVAALATIGVFAVSYYLAHNCPGAKFRRTAVIIFAAVLALESVLAYVETKKNMGDMEKDAIELAAYTDGTDSIFFDGGYKEYMVDHYAYDVQSRDTVYYTTFNSLINECDGADSVYSPYYITTIGEHVSYDTPLPDSAYLVFSGEEAALCDFNDGAEVYTTSGEMYTAVKTADNQRVFDSVYTSDRAGEISADNKCFITIYNPDMLGKTVHLKMKVASSNGSQTLTVTGGGSTKTVSVGTSEKWVECDVVTTSGYKWIDISSSTSAVYITAYELQA